MQVAPLKTYTYVLNASRVAAGKISTPGLRHGVAAALAAKQLWAARSRLRTGEAFTAAEICTFGADHDRLWEDVGGQYRCAVVRDSSYLQWKYVEQPGQEFTRTEVRRNGDIIGLVVTQVAEPDDVYHYRRGFIIDMVVDPTDESAVLATCQAGLQSLRGRNADLAIFYLISGVLGGQVERCGFWEREATRYLWVSPDTLSDEERMTITAHDSWLVTMGDSDIDRSFTE